MKEGKQKGEGKGNIPSTLCRSNFPLLHKSVFLYFPLHYLKLTLMLIDSIYGVA